MTALVDRRADVPFCQQPGALLPGGRRAIPCKNGRLSRIPGGFAHVKLHKTTFPLVQHDSLLPNIQGTRVSIAVTTICLKHKNGVRGGRVPLSRTSLGTVSFKK